MNIIITGASSGIGYQAVLHLLKSKENNVIALARNTDKLKHLEQKAATSRLQTFPFDIVNGNYENDLEPFIQNSFSQVDVLINNAGELIHKPFTDTTIEDFEQMLQSNYIGHVKMIQAVLPYMKTGTHIVNIGSMGGYQGSIKFPGLAAYSASKAALHTLTECLALEFTDRNIKVNCLALGSAQTEMLAKAFPGFKSPTSAEDMGRYIADFAIIGQQFFNGKVLAVSVGTP